MSQIDSQLSTGLSGLDRMITGLIPGDNIVWHADTVDEYKIFLAPYLKSALNSGRRLVYFRFATHDPLVSDAAGVEIVRLDVENGFENFVSEIHKIVRDAGRNTSYVFDCLSDIARYWLSDRMLGNFFKLICPYILDIEAIAYFCVLRGRQSADALEPIRETAQVVIDIFRHRGALYLLPQKVQRRHSSTMYMLHKWDGIYFTPVADSSTISEVMMTVSSYYLNENSDEWGYVNQVFRDAAAAWEKTGTTKKNTKDVAHLLRQILTITVSRDPRIIDLASKHLTIGDVLDIRKRMIGTGLIGGKAIGMLIADAILRNSGRQWDSLLERHDSFYVGSDVFYSFIVRNGIWFMREKQKDPESYLDGAKEARQRILLGTFPAAIREQFSKMLDYFGQSPVIVRSSSLLEDNFDNAFSGKYESVFCANQGSREKRLEDFISAVLTIYAGTMGEKALTYRAHRGLLASDEQMALLVQRVSGTMHDRLFYPHIAGVAYSYNPYVWSDRIDPDAGMLRLVFGLGTRAVDRVDDDYTRIVALNAPEVRPESGQSGIRKYAQHKIDLIDLDSNQLVTAQFPDIAARSAGLKLEMFASRDREVERRAAENGMRNVFSWVLTFNKLLQETEFVHRMREILQTLRESYGCNVDIEFTANFDSDNNFRISLVQCRPFMIKGDGPASSPPVIIKKKDLIVRSSGVVIGRSRSLSVDWIVFVSPAAYGVLPRGDRYEVARLLGTVTSAISPQRDKNIVLIGPGRWGSSMPELGIPATFSEIRRASVLCEVVAMNSNLVPEVSLGTHFFNDLVETDILYLALFPNSPNNTINEAFFTGAHNSLLEISPAATHLGDVVKVIDIPRATGGRTLCLHANVFNQEVITYIDAADRSRTQK